MFDSRLTKVTTTMIYIGTLMLSVLSFFTTYHGLTILLEWRLALIGSLGLQLAMLGIAWNLMKVRQRRGIYVVVFLTAAAFSIFFSFANFDSNLKASLRQSEARAGYSAEARPVLATYNLATKQAAVRKQYQVERLANLVELEQEKGWATLIDEGTDDALIQSVLEGARRTSNSWSKTMGSDYRQGKGRGIIANFLESHLNRARQNLAAIESYRERIDSLALLLSSQLPVSRQYELLNEAWISFPIGIVSVADEKPLDLPMPPAQDRFIEEPSGRQEAFMLVIGDFYQMDRLALFSLALAITIDLIVIMMAFTASFNIEETDYVMERVKLDSSRRIQHMSLDRPSDYTTVLDDNLKRFRMATDYRKKLVALLDDHRKSKKMLRFTMKRAGESTVPEPEQPIQLNSRPRQTIKADSGPTGKSYTLKY